MSKEILNAPIITCGSCGDLIPDTPEHNAFHGVIPYPADEGMGMCVECLEMAEAIVARHNTPKAKKMASEPEIKGEA